MRVTMKMKKERMNRLILMINEKIYLYLLISKVKNNQLGLNFET